MPRDFEHRRPAAVSDDHDSQAKNPGFDKERGLGRIKPEPIRRRDPAI
jgi:hypothetical protein